MLFTVLLLKDICTVSATSYMHSNLMSQTQKYQRTQSGNVHIRLTDHVELFLRMNADCWDKHQPLSSIWRIQNKL